MGPNNASKSFGRVDYLDAGAWNSTASQEQRLAYATALVGSASTIGTFLLHFCVYFAKRVTESCWSQTMTRVCIRCGQGGRGKWMKVINVDQNTHGCTEQMYHMTHHLGVLRSLPPEPAKHWPCQPSCLRRRVSQTSCLRKLMQIWLGKSKVSCRFFPSNPVSAQKKTRYEQLPSHIPYLADFGRSYVLQGPDLQPAMHSRFLPRSSNLFRPLKSLATLGMQWVVKTCCIILLILSYNYNVYSVVLFFGNESCHGPYNMTHIFKFKEELWLFFQISNHLHPSKRQNRQLSGW